MKFWSVLVAVLCSIARPALAASVAVGLSVSFPPGAPPPPSGLPLVRVFNNPLGSTSSSSAFEMMGQPFKAWPNSVPEVPPGNIVTAAWQTAGVPARIGVCRRKYDASGNLSIAQIMVDASAAAIPSGSSDTLVFSSSPGVFGNTTVAVTAESGGTFTIASGVMESGFAQRPIEYTGSLGGLAGFSLNHLYYAYYVSATTFTLWTEAGTQIIPTGSYTSGLSIVLDTSARSDADWEALNDTITIANVSTYSTSGPDMNAGPYTATFDGGATNTITVLCTSPVGREVQVSAKMVNSGSVAHCYLTANMDYWIPQTSGGAAGPIESIPVIENMQLFKGTADGCSGPMGEFTADLSWSRNGTLMRQFLDVPIPVAQIATLARPDGNWDYASNDPGFVITQDYTLVDATYKTPPYMHGIVYNGLAGNTYPAVAVSAVNTTTGLFSTSAQGNFITINPVSQVNGNPNIPISIQLTGSAGGLTGLSVCSATTGPCSSNTVYWTCRQASVPAFEAFFIYDTEFHAFACATGAGSGQIIPGGSYGGSGMSAGMAVAPESNGAYQAWGAEGTGGRPDLNLLTEWGTARLLASNTYTVGMTYLFQTMAREQAWALATMPLFAVDKTTNRTISFLDAGHTPIALGTAKTTSWFDCPHGSSDINGGANLPGGTAGHPDNACGMWQTSASDHAAGNPGYIIWLLEGNPYFERIGTIYANEGLISQSNIGERNAHNTAIGAGATFYAVANNPNVSKGDRGNAWQRRDQLQGRVFADDGSAEEQVYTTELSNDAASMTAYYAWKQSVIGNTSWHDSGLSSADDEGSGVLGNTNQPYRSNFMVSFSTTVAAWSEQLLGDFLPSMNTYAQNLGMFQEQMFANTANFCPGFGDTYNVGLELRPISVANPGKVVTTVNDIGAGASEYFFAFVPPSTMVFYSEPCESCALVPFEPYNEGVGVFAPVSVGDQYRPFNTRSEAGDTATQPPSNLTMGQDYPLLSLAGGNTQGQLDDGTGNPIPFTAGPGVQQAITNATWAGGVVTITVALDTGVRSTNADREVVMAGLTPSSLNGVFQTNPVSGFPNEFTYSVAGSGTPTFSGATETPLDGGTLVPTTYKGANCPATGMVHSGASPVAGSYANQIQAGICMQASVQAAQGLGASTWGVACTNITNRVTGGGFNGQAAFAMGPTP